MKERRGNIFISLNKADAIIIPTNITLRKDGNGIAGAGLAKAAQKIWPDFEIKLGKAVKKGGDLTTILFCHDKTKIISFPTKRDWRQKSDLKLIKSNLNELVILANKYEFKEISLPRVGCGLGGLNWNQVVKPICEKILDDRFTIFDL